MGFFSWQHIAYFIIIYLILNATGLWPILMRALADLRGDARPGQRRTPAAPAPSQSNLDMCYRLLGLSPSAKWDEIERAYRAKAKKHHPDHGGDEDAMRALNEAYAMLKRARKPR